MNIKEMTVEVVQYNDWTLENGGFVPPKWELYHELEDGRGKSP